MPEQKLKHDNQPVMVLGVEGGGTKTTWILLRCVTADEKDWEVVKEGRLPAANFKLISHKDLLALLGQLPTEVDRVGLHLPGVLDQEDCTTLHNLAKRIWPDATIVTGSDRESGLAAAFGHGQGILVISGTGSSMTGRRGAQMEKAGGQGHLVGDRGSAYHVAMDALRLVMDRHDETKRPCRLAKVILQHLSLAHVDDIIDWVQKANKHAIAHLAIHVFQVYTEGDTALLTILQNGADALAHATAIVAKRLKMAQPTVALQGSMFSKQKLYVQLFQNSIKCKLPKAKVILCQKSGDFGSARLAMTHASTNSLETATSIHTESKLNLSNADILNYENLVGHEKTNVVDLFNNELRCVVTALEKVKESLTKAIECLTDKIESGSRVFFVGIESMCEQSQVLNATVIQPFYKNIKTEVDESDLTTTVKAETQQDFTAKDVVLGVLTSGQTTFVLEVLETAQQTGATTLLVTCSDHHITPKSYHIHIKLDVGVEQSAAGISIPSKWDTAATIAINLIYKSVLFKLRKTS